MNHSFLRCIRARIVVMCLLVGASPTAQAQGTGIVPSGRLVYADIERLAELGALDSIILGQRPYSRREIARIARVARQRLDRGRPGAQRPEVDALAEQVLRRVELAGEEVGDTPLLMPLDAASLVVISTDVQRRSLLSPETRATEATIDPLAERRLGRPANRGLTTALDLSHRAEPTPWLSLQVSERLQLARPRGDTTFKRSAELLLASARLRARNVALTVGRQQLTWGQGAGEGLFLASDAPALDALSLTADQPFRLPSLLRYAGPTQATFVYALLGASVVRSQSRLLAYKVSVQPHSSVELGGTFMNHFGGAGGRKSSFKDQLIDFLPFIDVFRRHNYTDTTRAIDVDSDKTLGVDGRWRMPVLGGALLTGELLIDDFDVNRIPKLLTGYGSQTVSLTFPTVGRPDLSLRVSAKHLGIITYSHFALLNGTTTRGRLLGDELGPDAKSFGAQLRWAWSPDVHLEVEGRHAVYSNATYAGFYSDSAGTRYVVTKTSQRPDELRSIVLGNLIVRGGYGLSYTARVGAELIRNSGSVQGARRRDYVAQLGLQLEP